MAFLLEYEHYFGSSEPWFKFASIVTTTSLVVILSIISTTWSLSLLRSRPAQPGTNNEPPVALYYVPYLQHLIEFLSDPNKLLQSLRYAFQLNQQLEAQED